MACVLVVDDRAANRHYVAQVLAHVGHEVLHAADGSEALDVVEQARPDLVITDVLMPVMDGVEFAQRVRASAQLSATRIIFYTATYRSSDARRLADACGVDTVLAKPASPAALLTAVADALSRADAAAASDSDDDEPHGTVSAWSMLSRSLAGEAEAPARGTTSGASVEHARLRRSASRMAALMEATLDLAAERERRSFLKLFCDAAMRLLDARGAVLALVDDALVIREVEARGLAPPSAQTLLGRPVDGSALALVWHAHGGVRHSLGPDALPGAVGPGPWSALAVRLGPSHAGNGALLLWRAASDGGFDDDDEMFALAMAAEFAVLFELLDTHASLSASAAELRIEADQRRHSEQALARSHRELAWFSQRLLEQEKGTTQRLALALHDELGQTLTALRLVHDAATMRGSGAIGPDEARRIGELIGVAHQQLRGTLSGLRPALLDEQGLIAALERELRECTRLYPQVALVLHAPAGARWPADVEYAAFMVAREALHNALRHAQARSVDVSIDGVRERLALRVADDGIGMAQLPAEQPGHLGLVGMRERARTIGAVLAIESTVSAGTIVRLEWKDPEPCDAGST